LKIPFVDIDCGMKSRRQSRDAQLGRDVIAPLDADVRAYVLGLFRLA
jgi:hypothetical protein